MNTDNFQANCSLRRTKNMTHLDYMWFYQTRSIVFFPNFLLHLYTEYIYFLSIRNPSGLCTSPNTIRNIASQSYCFPLKIITVEVKRNPVRYLSELQFNLIFLETGHLKRFRFFFFKTNPKLLFLLRLSFFAAPAQNSLLLSPWKTALVLVEKFYRKWRNFGRARYHAHVQSIRWTMMTTFVVAK